MSLSILLHNRLIRVTRAFSNTLHRIAITSRGDIVRILAYPLDTTTDGAVESLQFTRPFGVRDLYGVNLVIPDKYNEVGLAPALIIPQVTSHKMCRRGALCGPKATRGWGVAKCPGRTFISSVEFFHLFFLQPRIVLSRWDWTVILIG
jgi:hypothetical protein